MAVPVAALDAVAATLSLARTGVGAVEPGQQVDVSVVSSLADLTVLDPLPVPVPVPVRIDVQWSVVGPGGDLTKDNDYLVSTVGALAAGFLVKPPIYPMRTDTPADPLSGWQVRARVTVAVDQVVSAQRELLLPLSLVPLRIPELAALFRHDHFKPYDDDEPGFLLLVVPADSPIRAIGPTFDDLMNELDRLVRPLRALAGIAAFLTGIETLRLAAAGQPLTRVFVGDPSDLEGVHMRVETFLGSDWLNRDLRAGDRTTAVVVFGPPGTTYTFYDDEDWTTAHGEWAFSLTTGLELSVVIRDLRPDSPETLPPGLFHLVAAGGGASFNDNLTSVKLTSAPLPVPEPPPAPGPAPGPQIL